MPLTEPAGVYRPRHPECTVVYRLFEDDPLLCPACGSEMKIVSVIMEPDVIDAILRHLKRTGMRDPFEGRAPPAA